MTGWTTQLKSTHRRADVTYSRVNDTILEYDFAQYASKDAPITSSDLLSVFDAATSGKSNDSAVNSALELLGTSSNVPLSPLYIWWYLKGYDDIASSDLDARLRAIIAVESVLVTSIYNCQDKGWAELYRAGYGGQLGITELIFSQFPTPKSDVPIYPAKLRYVLVVSSDTLIAYAALAGVSLASCFLTLVFRPLWAGYQTAMQRTSFPTMDFVTKCNVEDEMGQTMSDMSLKELQGLDSRALLIMTAKLRVVPPATPTVNELQDFSPEKKSETEVNQDSSLLRRPHTS